MKRLKMEPEGREGIKVGADEMNACVYTHAWVSVSVEAEYFRQGLWHSRRL